MDLIFALVNTSKLAGWVRSGVGALFVMVSGRWPMFNQWVDPATQIEIAAAIATLAVGVWSHLAKSYAETPPAIPGYHRDGSVGNVAQLLFLAVALSWLLAAITPASAQVVTKTPPSATSGCTTVYCTGWYVGGGFAGNGTNADIIGSGLSGSVFAAGAIPFVNGGWQYWNGTTFLAIEAGVGDQVNVGGVTNNEGGVLAYQEAQVGGTLSGIFGTQAPVVVPSNLTADLISLYVAAGIVERGFATGFETGAGAKFVIAPKIILDIGYRYLNYGSASVGVANAATASFNAENLVRASLEYKF